MTNTEITTGDKVTYTNRKGTVITGTVTHVHPAEVYARPTVIVEMHDGPMAGEEKNFAVKDLVIVD